SPSLCTVFAAMQRVEAITLPLIADELGRSGELEKAGGLVALAELSDGACTAAHVDIHARMVRKHSLERTLRKYYDRGSKGEDVVADLERVQRSLAELDAMRANLDSILLSGERLRALRDLEVTASPLPGLLDSEASLHVLQGRAKSGKNRLAYH